MEYTILVAEDEPLQLDSIAGFLSKQGYRVLKAARPALALDLAREQAVDLVLTDLRMPVRLREHRWFAPNGREFDQAVIRESEDSEPARCEFISNFHRMKELDIFEGLA